MKQELFKLIGFSLGILFSMNVFATEVNSPSRIVFLEEFLKNNSDFNSKTLSSLPSWPDEVKLEGDLRHWEKVVFKGEQIVGVIWLSMPGILKLENYPFDQTVFVLEGSITLTEKGRESKTYYKGDIFFLPKGFTGTWKMKNKYKELIIVDKKAWTDLAGE